MSNKIRTFIALPLPQPVRERIYRLTEPLRQLSLHVKWVEPENYHLTLRFFGDLTPGEIENAGGVLSRVVAATRPFTLNCGEGGAFPNRKYPRILWLDLAGETEQLQDLWRRMDDELRKADFPPSEKPFRPHLTLGRLRRSIDIDIPPEQWQKMTIPFDEGSFTVTQVNLMASRLTPAGPHYTPIKVYRCRII